MTLDLALESPPKHWLGNHIERTTPRTPGPQVSGNARPPDVERNSAMTMGYDIKINHAATEHLCPLCGHLQPAQPGLAVVQHPSGDVVCEACAKAELRALFSELCVLRDDTPNDFPDSWQAIEARLSSDPDTDPEFSRLLASVALQRDPTHPPLKGTKQELR
jgi:hypothetical protein